MILPHRATIETRSQDQDLAFSAGTAAFAAGTLVTGAESGATGTVETVTLDDGTWAGGDAAGTLRLVDVTGAFEPGEVLAGAPAGAAVAGTSVGVAASLGTPRYSWIPAPASVRCRFYLTSPYPARVLPSGETVRKIPMVQLRTAIVPHEQRLVTATEGYAGTYGIVGPKPCGGSGRRPHHYEYELEAVIAP